VAVVTESANPDKAQAFIDFLRTPEAQRIFGEKGYRPILPEVLTEFDYPTPPNLFTIADHGGWAEVTSRFFDPDNGLVAQIVQQ
jgi:sulfate transport system substrate-binding protein